MDNNSVPPVSGNAPFESAFALFKQSRQAVGLNLGTIVQLILLPLIPFVIVGGLPFLFRGSSTGNLLVIVLTLLIVIFTFIYSVLFGAGLVFICLQSVRGQRVTFKEVLNAAKPFFWRYLGLIICLAVIYIVALLLFIVPFFFMLRRYFLAPYYMLDRNLSISEALRQSAADSKKYSGALWGVLGVQFLLGIPSVIPLIGSIITLILGICYICAPAIRYIEITKHETLSTPPVATAPQPPVEPRVAPPTAPAPPRPLIQ